MKVNKSIRLRTEPGLSKNISFKIEQEFDTLDFLSLQITQQEAYRDFCSDYGVVAGRVVANDGFGVANAKVCIFIPITDEDLEDPIISEIYPYTTPTDTNSDGIRYNLLPKVGRRFFIRVKINNIGGLPQTPLDVTDAYAITSLGTFVTGSSWEIIPSLSTSGFDGYSIYEREVIANTGPQTPVGTFPSKFETLDDDVLLEVYEKYYKLSTRTNESGDYMIFGVPIGTKTVHMDVDLSDTGSVSLSPEDFIQQGFSPNLFSDDGQGFPSSSNLDSLPQIEGQNISVDVIPFWGDLEQCEIGITRLDFSLNKKITPSALLVFQAFTNADGLYRKPNCSNDPGGGNAADYRDIVNMQPLNVTVACTKGHPSLPIKVQQTFTDGNVILPLPMYENFKVTNEVGELVDGADGKGVPTGGLWSTFAWGTETRHMGSAKEEGTSLHSLYQVRYRYDLVNRKRLIYTAGLSHNDNENNKTNKILSQANPPKLSYPNNDYQNGTCFINGMPVFGSLYFPKHEMNNNQQVCIDVAWSEPTTFTTYPQFGNSVTIHAPNRTPYGVGVLDITDILHIFKPFGGVLAPTTANNGLYNNFTSPTTTPNGDNNQNDQTILLRSEPTDNNEDSTGRIEFPNRLNTMQTADPVDANLNGFFATNPGPPGGTDGNLARLFYNMQTNSGVTSKRGRYYFYFGLSSNNNILEKLNTYLGE